MNDPSTIPKLPHNSQPQNSFPSTTPPVTPYTPSVAIPQKRIMGATNKTFPGIYIWKELKSGTCATRRQVSRIIL